MEWLCENAKTLDGDRRSRSLNLKIELKNVTLSARSENIDGGFVIGVLMRI
jgi:hypothetical protein